MALVCLSTWGLSFLVASVGQCGDACPPPFGQPDAKDRLDRSAERDRSLLAAFALAAHVRAGAQDDVTAVETEQL